MAGKSVLILNDTEPVMHHGCSRVMRVLRTRLAERGLRIAGSWPVGKDWVGDAGFDRLMREADLIVINGEGTLHHGKTRAETLLRTVDHPGRDGKPIVLINALYQQNPRDWQRYLDKFALIRTRDSRSAAEISSVTGKDVAWVPDLSMCDGFWPDAGKREGILIGDSVIRSVSADLAQSLRKAGARAQYLPIASILSIPSRFRIKQLRSLEAWALARWPGLRQRMYPEAGFVATEAEYLGLLARAQLHVTGRFHGACISLAARTPFLTMTSNSWKIEAMLEDSGLGYGRLNNNDLVSEALADPAKAAFSEEEASKIDAFIGMARRQSDAMFDDIASLAG